MGKIRSDLGHRVTISRDMGILRASVDSGRRIDLSISPMEEKNSSTYTRQKSQRCSSHSKGQALSRCRIYTDSQTAIKAIERPQRQSGQSIIKDLLDCVDEIMDKHRHLQIDIMWIPGHSEIQGKRASGCGGQEGSSGLDLKSIAQAQATKISQDKTHKNGSKGTVAKDLDRGY